MSLTAYLVRITAEDYHRVTKKRSAVKALMDAEREDRPGKPGVRLEVAWWRKLIQFLVAGSLKGGDPILRDLIYGGTPIGSEYEAGPVRFLSPSRVREVAAELEMLNWGELRSRYDDDTLMQAGGWDPMSDEDWDTGCKVFEEIRSHYKDAARLGNAMMLYLA